MVCIIIDDRKSVDFTFVFKTTVSAVEGLQTFFDLAERNSEKISDCDCRQCIGYIVVSVDR